VVADVNDTSTNWHVFEYGEHDGQSFVANPMGTRNFVVTDLEHGPGTPLIQYTMFAQHASFIVSHWDTRGTYDQQQYQSTGRLYGFYADRRYVGMSDAIPEIGQPTEYIGLDAWTQDIARWSTAYHNHDFAVSAGLYGPNRNPPNYYPYTFAIQFTGTFWRRFSQSSVAEITVTFPSGIRPPGTYSIPHVRYLTIPLQIVGFSDPLPDGHRYPIAGTTTLSLLNALYYIIGNVNNIEPYYRAGFDPSRNYRPLIEHYNGSADTALFTPAGPGDTVWSKMGDAILAQDPTVQLFRGGSSNLGWLGALAAEMASRTPV